MKRRDFNKSLAAALVAPVMPAKALAAAPAAAAPMSPGLYSWSVAIARAQGKCSAGMLSRMLHIDPTRADCLFKAMIGNNIVGQTNALGVSAVKSAMPSPTGIEDTLNTEFDPEVLKEKAREYLGLSEDDDPMPVGDFVEDPDPEPEETDEDPTPDLQA